MPKVNILYLGTGRYRKETGIIDANWVTQIQNKKKKHCHSLGLGPVFPELPPVKVNSLDELLTFKPDGHLSYSKEVVLIPDGHFMPLLPEVYPEEVQGEIEANLRLQAFQEGVQKARSEAEKKDNSYQGMALIIVALIAGLVVIIFGTLILSQRLGQ